jgi:hypothetical protein
MGMELKEATLRTPTIEDLEDLVSRLDRLVYIQFSESGAVRRAGDGHKTPLHLTSAPLPIFGPQLFPD